MMDGFSLLQGILSLIQTAALIGLMVALFYKAGLLGPVMATAFLPLVGSALNTMLTPMLMRGDTDPSVFLLTFHLVNAVCYLTPLLLLVVMKWPALNNSRAKVEIFK